MSDRNIINRGISKCAANGLFNFLPDRAYLKLLYWARTNCILNLNSPHTFNEKLQWLKLNYRRDEMTNLVDKYEAKKIVAETIGDEHIIPTIGVWESFDDIDFTSLPDQFVLKCTHDSGGLVICTNKDQFDAETARKKINKSLLTNYYLHDREWPYKNVKRRIIAEEYIEDKNSKHGLHDYKMFIFNGEFKAFYVTSDRGSKTGTCIDIFDKNCNRLPFKWGYPNSNYEFKKPKNWETMIELAERLGKGYPHVRVDFYNLNGKIMFGEMTFFTWGGLVPFEPEEWDYKFGEWITLTKEKITDEH